MEDICEIVVLNLSFLFILGNYVNFFSFCIFIYRDRRVFFKLKVYLWELDGIVYVKNLLFCLIDI